MHLVVPRARACPVRAVRRYVARLASLPVHLVVPRARACPVCAVRSFAWEGNLTPVFIAFNKRHGLFSP